MHARKLALALGGLALAFSATAHAHFILVSPPAVVVGEPNGKGSPPCGNDVGMAATPTPAQGGHPLMVKVQETVGHLGFYRVALALKSRSEFTVDNVVYDAAGKVLPPTGKPTGESAKADTAVAAMAKPANSTTAATRARAFVCLRAVLLTSPSNRLESTPAH